MRQPGVGRDLDRTPEEVAHTQRHRSHSGEQRPGALRTIGAQPGPVTPEEDATRDEADESQQHDEADRDADGERDGIASHRLRDDRQHQADHEPLARRQPWRPTRRQAQAEDQAANNQC